jgi:predicted O-methyltransferase YrrM
MNRAFHKLRRKLFPVRSVRCRHDKTDSAAWLTGHLPQGDWTPPPSVHATLIRRRLRRTERRQDGARSAVEVSTFGPLGNALCWLVREREPKLVVEIGTAFGFSGMYLLSGMIGRGGVLLTFEPNRIWAWQARLNLQGISNQFRLIEGTFEENLNTLPKEGVIDLTLIDAIHTPEFVKPQFELTARRSRPGALILVDDVDFSPEMETCWRDLAADSRIRAAVVIDRLGVLELS